MHVRRSRGFGVTLFIVIATVFFAELARSTAPRPLALAVALILVTILAWALKPMVGLCLTVYFALVGDGTSMPWYPFVKGFSARESILYVSKSFIFSPLELVLVCAVLAMLGRFLVIGRWELSVGKLPYAVGAFVVFIVLGLAHGYLNGGNRQIALVETRPFLAFAVIYVLTSSVCTSLAHYRYLLWSILLAIATHALISSQYLSNLTSEQLDATESILDHGAAMRMDVLILAAAAAWLFPGTSKSLRRFSTVMLLPVGFVYLLAQRRAAVVGLVGAFAIMAVVLFWHRRRAFFRIVPIFALVLAGYVGAFWNSQSSAAFPAQAIKSVISPDQVSNRNQSSDQYRIIENIDLHYTIQTAKLQGVGFGNPFFRPYPLPALSTSFIYALYIPHNSFLWIWMTTGFGGFVAMIYMLGRSVSLGAATVRTWSRGSELVVLLSFVLAVVVFAIFCFVDIAWDAGNLVLLGASVAVCANYPLNRSPASVVVEEAEQGAGDAQLHVAGAAR